MPPKAELTKEKIILAAFELVREEGLEALTTRRIAQRLRCSTQPIYSVCGSMEEIRNGVYARASECAKDYMTGYKDDSKSAALNLAIGFMHFAQKEREIFRALYLTGYLQYDPDKDMLLGFKLLGVDAGEHYFQRSSRIYKLSNIQRRRLYLKLTIYLVGIGTLLNTNTLKLDMDEIAEMVVEMYEMLLVKEGIQ